MKIAFEAIIKKQEIVQLVSGDNQVNITLQLNDKSVNKETLDALNELYLKQLPNRLMAVIMTKDEADKVTGK